LKHHYIWGRTNWQFGADYIGKKNLSQKCGDLRCIERFWTYQYHEFYRKFDPPTSSKIADIAP
jgi:hypothetical protein